MNVGEYDAKNVYAVTWPCCEIKEFFSDLSVGIFMESLSRMFLV